MASSNDSSAVNENTPHWARRLGNWLFEQSSNFWVILAFVVIAGLMGISLAFNYNLGQAQGTDPTSRLLLPRGYAGLDLAAVVLLAVLATLSDKFLRKTVAVVWATFLIILSLWAAASYTLMNDELKRRASLQISGIISEKKMEVDQAQKNINYWAKQKETTRIYKQEYQNRQDKAAAEKRRLQRQLAGLRQNNYPAAMAINYHTSSLLKKYYQVSITPESVATLIRLLFSGALTLTPIVLVALLSGLLQEKGAFNRQPPTPRQKQDRWIGRFSKRFVSAPFSTSSKENLTPTGNPALSEIKLQKPYTGWKSTEGKADTAISGPKSVRYQTIKELVREGKVRPSVPGMKKASKEFFETGCNQKVATSYLEAMASEGIIQKRQNGYYKLIDPQVIQLRTKFAG